MPAHGANCYKATCYETSRLLAQGLGLAQTNYSVSFQSRLSKKWMTPFTDQTLKDFIGQGKKKILVVAPSFVTDCLETIVEIKYEYQSMFLEAGGKKLDMVPSLNDTNEWASAIETIIKT
jgi:ferrochelatase